MMVPSIVLCINGAELNISFKLYSYSILKLNHLVVEILINTSPTLASVKNNYGNTFLHVAVAGFRTPGFQRIDRQIELMKQLVCGEVVDVQEIIDIRNLDGKIALHMAITENVQPNLAELLTTVPSIDLNIRDADGMTLLDLLKRQPKSASFEILIKELIAARGMISNSQDKVARKIFLYTGSENSYDRGCDQESVEYSSCLSELNDLNLSNLSDYKKSSSINHVARRLKFFLRWHRKKERKAASTESVDDDPLGVMSTCRNWPENHIPLCKKCGKSSSVPNNKRTSSLRSDLPSQSTRKKFTAELTHGVVQAAPDLAAPFKSPLSPFSGSSVASAVSMDEQKGAQNAQNSFTNPSLDGKTTKINQKQTSLYMRLMNQYFCLGAKGLAVENIRSHTLLDRGIKSVRSLVA
ncbi:hypothetical protein DITRI_Ditri17bG0077300 [Diplodiscus trichospermus]